jgi:hypothetical protein
VTAALELSFGTGLADADGCREMKGRRKGWGRGEHVVVAAAAEIWM